MNSNSQKPQSYRVKRSTKGPTVQLHSSTQSTQMRDAWLTCLTASGVAGSILGFCFWTVSSSCLLFQPSQPLERGHKWILASGLRVPESRHNQVRSESESDHLKMLFHYLAALKRAEVSLLATASATWDNSGCVLPCKTDIRRKPRCKLCSRGDSEKSELQSLLQELFPKASTSVAAARHN